MTEKSQDVFRSTSSAVAEGTQPQPQPKEPVASYVQSFLSDLCFWDGGGCAFGEVLPHQALVDARHGPPRKAMSQDSLIAVGGNSSNTSPSSLGKAQSFEQLPSRRELRWQAAADPATGRTYYYDTVTLETQWNKPSEIRNWEKHAKRERKRQDKQFFKEMEQNIFASLERREPVPGIASVDALLPSSNAPSLRQDTHPGVKVRTLSGMDEKVLSASLVSLSGPLHTSSSSSSAQQPQQQQQPSSGRPSLAPRPSQPEPFEAEQQPSAPQHRDSRNLLRTKSAESESSSAAGPGHVRRSTGGPEDVYAESTIIQPNVAATIQSVCAIFRAHVVQSEQDKAQQPQQKVLHGLHTDIFRDANPMTIPVKVPSLQEIVTFYSDYYETSRMQEDTILMSLIYLERLLQRSDGILRPTSHNWRSLLFSCMVLASKVWDDFSLWNVDFCHASAAVSGRKHHHECHGFSLRRINDLEVAVLTCLQFDVRVTDSVYAKYYFRLRSLQIRSGLLWTGKTKNDCSPQQQHHMHQPPPPQQFVAVDKTQKDDQPNPKSMIAAPSSKLPLHRAASDLPTCAAASATHANRQNCYRRSKSADWNGVLSSIYQSAATVGSNSSVSMIPGYSQALSDIVVRTTQTLQ